jgi:hypothetical protein
MPIETLESQQTVSEKSVFDIEDLLRVAKSLPLHSDGSLPIIDSGDLCDSDCRDCD